MLRSFETLTVSLFFLSQFFVANTKKLDFNKIDLRRQITKITYNVDHDTIFVGGQNFISALSSDLYVIFLLGIGPVLDPKDCFPHPAPCDNNVTVLEYDRFNNGLLVCGTAYQGTCILHNPIYFQEFTCITAQPNMTSNRISAPNTGTTVVQILDTLLEQGEPQTDAEETIASPSDPFGCRPPDYGQESYEMETQLMNRHDRNAPRMAAQANASKQHHEAGGTDDAHEAGGTDDAHEAGGTDDAHEAGGTDDAHEAGGTDDAHGAGGIDDAHGAGGTDDAHGAGGTDDAHGAGGTDDAHGAGGIDDAHGAGGIDDAHGAGGTDGASGAEGSDGSMTGTAGFPSPSPEPGMARWSYATPILVASWSKPLDADQTWMPSQPIFSLRKMRRKDIDFDMSFMDGQDASKTGIHVKRSENFDSYFKYVFTDGNFTYVLSLRTKVCERNEYCTVSILSRMSNTNPSGTPYFEIPLTCSLDIHKYELILSASAGKVSSETNGSYFEMTILIVAFGKEDVPGSRRPDPDMGSAICVFSLDFLHKQIFNTALQDCQTQAILIYKSPPWIAEADDNCENGYLHIDEYLLPTKGVPIKEHVLAIMTHTPVVQGERDKLLNDKMHVYLANQKGHVYKLTVKPVFKHFFGFDATFTTPEEELSHDVSQSLLSQVPTSSGVTHHDKALSYLAYGTEIVAFKLDLCQQYKTCTRCQQHAIQCGWCPRFHTCFPNVDFRLRCNEDGVSSCPPEIEDFNPKEVPLSGGSKITLIGRHLGSPSRGPVYVKICKYPCRNVQPNMNTLVCTVPPSRRRIKCFIQVKVEQKESSGETSTRTMPKAPRLSYIVPKVVSISPTFGPVSGGIILSVQGEHLQVGSQTYLEVLGTRCENIPGGMETGLTCQMDKANSYAIGQCGPITLHIDRHVSTNNDTQYCFRDDPTIRTVQPAATLIQGGLTLAVNGTSLDSVGRLTFYLAIKLEDVNSSRVELYNSPCEIMTSSSMRCNTPDMDNLRKPLANVVHTQGYLLASMYFLMDNRARVKMEKSREFRIYPIPSFKGVGDDKSESFIYKNLEDNLYTVLGEDIPDWLEPDDVEIIVGLTACPVKKITSKKIFCDVTDILKAYNMDRKVLASTTEAPENTEPTTNTSTTEALQTSEPPDNAHSTMKPGVTSDVIEEIRNASDIVTISQTTIPSERNSSITTPEPGQSPLEIVDLAMGDDVTTIYIKNITKQNPLNGRKDYVKIRNDTNDFQYRLTIKIGQFRQVLGYVTIGREPDDNRSRPTEKVKTVELDIVLVAGICGASFLFLLIVAFLCVFFIKSRKRRVQKSPYFMNDACSSHPGSSEVSMPSLTQILKLELGDDKKGEIKKLLISSDRLLLGKAIGSGNFGCVYEGMLAPEGKEAPMKIAVKTLQDPVSHVINLREFVKEAIIMVGFQHPHVLGLVGLAEKELGVPYVVLPYMDNGDLLTYVRDAKRTLSLYDVIQFCADICNGMAYLSSVKLVHRDLAARNCMLDNGYRAKVADFGLCRDIYEKGYYKSDNKKKLPIRWMAIESIEQGAYSTKSDVWSMGVVLWEMLTRGVTPYPGVDGWDIINFLQKRRLSPPHFCPDKLYRLMMTCWAKEPETRPTFEALHKELLLLVGQDPRGSTPVVTQSQKSKGQASPSNKNQAEISSSSKKIDNKPTPEIEITAGAPKNRSEAVELLQMKTSDEPEAAIEVDKGSCMSLPKIEPVENVIIIIPACYNTRNVSKSAAVTYLQLVDNYEPAPKFFNPFIRSKKKRYKSEPKKSGSRKERNSSSRSKTERASGGSGGGGERRSTPNDYSRPFESKGVNSGVSFGMRGSDTSDGHARGPVDIFGYKGGSNYFELERNSQQASTNSILDANSSANSSMVMGQMRSKRSPDTRCSSAAVSYQSVALSEDLDRSDSQGNFYDRLSTDCDEIEDGHGFYHSWQEPTVEFQTHDNEDGYDRLSRDYIDSEITTRYQTFRDANGNVCQPGPGELTYSTKSPNFKASIDPDQLRESADSDISPNYHTIGEDEATPRPDSKADNYNRISDLEDLAPGYQVWDQPAEQGQGQEGNETTLL